MICVIFRVDGVLCGPGSGLLSLLGLGGRRPWGYPGGGETPRASPQAASPVVPFAHAYVARR